MFCISRNLLMRNQKEALLMHAPATSAAPARGMTGKT